MKRIIMIALGFVVAVAGLVWMGFGGLMMIKICELATMKVAIHANTLMASAGAIVAGAVILIGGAVLLDRAIQRKPIFS